MNIIQDKREPKNVLESYAFTLCYEKTSGFPTTAKVIVTSSDSNRHVTIKRAKSSVYNLIQHLVLLVQTLPILPGMTKAALQSSLKG